MKARACLDFFQINLNLPPRVQTHQTGENRACYYHPPLLAIFLGLHDPSPREWPLARDLSRVWSGGPLLCAPVQLEASANGGGSDAGTQTLKCPHQTQGGRAPPRSSDREWRAGSLCPQALWTSDLFPVQENNCTFFSLLLVWHTWSHFLNKPKSEQERLSSGSSRWPSKCPHGWEVQRTPLFVEQRARTQLTPCMGSTGQPLHGRMPARRPGLGPGGPRGTPPPLSTR